MLLNIFIIAAVVIVWKLTPSEEEKAKKKIMENVKGTSEGSSIVERFKYEEELATETPESKYSIDLASINKALSLCAGLSRNNISRGIQMQNEDGPQTDWAIAGGIANGIAGSGVGMAVALKTMQDNAEATRKHHENGRKLVKDGLNRLNEIEDEREQINSIVTHRSDDFTYTSLLPELLNYFELNGKKTVSISDNEKLHFTTFTKSNTVKFSINAVDFYDNLGYFRANVSIINKVEEMMPDSKDKERIDGGFRIDLYDGRKKFAYGYVSDGSWTIQNHSDVGFKSKIEKTIVFKIIDSSESLIANKEYRVKFSKPNLWLVKL